MQTCTVADLDIFIEMYTCTRIHSSVCIHYVYVYIYICMYVSVSIQPFPKAKSARFVELVSTQPCVEVQAQPRASKSP